MMKVLAMKFAKGAMSRSELRVFFQNAEKEFSLIYANLLKASQLVERFKKVSTDDGVDDIAEFAPVPLCEGVLREVSVSLLKRNVRMRVLGDRGLVVESQPKVVADVALHLVNNSLWHAFEGRESGLITLSFEIVNSMLRFEYGDDGIGMSRSVSEHVFDPFFTTKRGQGAGLGLHIVYNSIVHKCRGTIRCESQQGHGVKFVMELPVLSSSGKLVSQDETTLRQYFSRG
jgi:signal transduction histidine kinase